MHLVWDIEGNGLHEIVLDQKGQPKPECTKVHCLVAVETSGKETMHTFLSHEIKRDGTFLFSRYYYWSQYSWIRYSVMERITGKKLPSSVKVVDTLLMAMLLWPDRSACPAGATD